MNYLAQLKRDLIASFDLLSSDKVQLHILNGTIESGRINYIVRFDLLDCRLNEPFLLFAFINNWFDKKGLAIPTINFDFDVIDLETYDLQIDINLSDKFIITEQGATICPPVEWSDAVGGFISSAITAPYE